MQGQVGGPRVVPREVERGARGELALHVQQKVVVDEARVGVGADLVDHGLDEERHVVVVDARQHRPGALAEAEAEHLRRVAEIAAASNAAMAPMHAPAHVADSSLACHDWHRLCDGKRHQNRLKMN